MTAISRRTLTDQVAEAVLELLSQDDLAAGDPIPSSGELARRFDVSVVVVREAIAQLAGRGVLSRRQGREPVVAVPGPQILAETLAMHARHDKIPGDDFLICRAALEGEAAALAAARGDSTSRAEALTLALQRLRSATTRKAFSEADVSFHLTVAELSGNRALEVILASLNGVIRTEIIRRTGKESGTAQSGSLQRHEDVFDAIVRGNAHDARTAMALHFDRALPGFAASHGVSADPVAGALGTDPTA